MSHLNRFNPRQEDSAHLEGVIDDNLDYFILWRFLPVIRSSDWAVLNARFQTVYSIYEY